MNFKAIVYDTIDREPLEVTVTSIFCDESGQPTIVEAIVEASLRHYTEFKLWDDAEPCKENGYKQTDKT